MNKKFNLSKFFIFLLLYILLYGSILVWAYDFDYAFIFRSPSTAIKIGIIYAIIASVMDAVDIAYKSEDRTKALRTGYTTHKFIITEDGIKKFNFQYLLSAFSWGLFISFLLFIILSKESDKYLLIFNITLIIGLVSGLFTANIWGRTTMHLCSKKNQNK